MNKKQWQAFSLQTFVIYETFNEWDLLCIDLSAVCGCVCVCVFLHVCVLMQWVCSEALLFGVNGFHAV